MTNTLPIDTYYRGYRLSTLRQGTPTETVSIWHGTDHLGFVPTIDQAKRVVDEYQDAR